MKNEIYSRVACYDMTGDTENIYYYANEKNLLGKYNKKTNKNHILKEFDEDLTYTYASIQKMNERLILIPHHANDILVYDLETNEVVKIPVEIPKGHKDIKFDEIYKFWDSFVYKDYVYIIGFFYPAIIKLNTLTLETEYLTECCDYIEKKKTKDVDVYFVHGEVIENAVWISCGSCNIMLRLDLESMIFEYYTIALIDTGCGAFLYDGKHFWIGEWGAHFEKIVQWNPVEKIEKEFGIFGKKTNGWCPIRSIVEDGDKLHIVSFGDVEVYQLDKNTGQVEKSEINHYCDCDIYNKDNWRIVALKQNGTSLRFITGDYIWHEYDLKTKCYCSYEVKVDNMRILLKVTEKKFSKNIVQYENYGTLPIYLKYVLNKVY